MLTYVINTSENRTLDSDQLFDLAGYNKIRWMNHKLCDIDQCAQLIFEKQNILGAEDFRIAVLVDFFNFDRVRSPYGRLGYRKESGVDISLYLPYIEVYLLDNLIGVLEKQELIASDFEIYYVQNTKLERYEFLDNADEQIRQILSGKTEVGDEDLSQPPLMTKEERKQRIKEGLSVPEDETSIPDEDRVLYSEFSLYCTETVSLTFKLTDYPYPASALTFPDFVKAFNSRLGEKNGIRRHYYVSNYGGGHARAAFDTLSLALYLVYMYEREDDSQDEEVLEIKRIDPETLKDVLVRAWNKICCARSNAKSNATTYYSLRDNLHIDNDNLQPKTKAGMEFFERLREKKPEEMSAEALYKEVCRYYYRTPEQLEKDNREEFDRLMNEYLRRRDETTEMDIEAEMTERIRDGSIITTPQFPSEEDYRHLTKEKEKEISTRFDNVLSATYQEVNYDKEKERADIAYEEYCKVKACLHRNIVGDVIFMILALLASLVPYVVLQLNSFNVSSTKAVFLGLQATAIFALLFILAVIIQIIVLTAKLIQAKQNLRAAYQDCFRKECDSLVQIRQRYEEDLIYIERARYELRQLKFIYDANLVKVGNVRKHRSLLEELEDRLGGMLNNLDVEPVFDPEETVDDAFDLTKPIRARENRVYRIFSLETIEHLFEKKGRDSK